MELIKSHIKSHQEEFINSICLEKFNEVYELITDINKKEIILLLMQIFRVIELSINNSTSEINYVHINFQNVLNKSTKTIIAEFIWYLFFQIHKQNDSTDFENINLISRINEIESLLKREIIAPSNNDKREFKKIVNYRKKLRKELAFYKSLPNTSSLVPKTLINLKINQEKDLCERFEPYPHYLKIQLLGILNSYTLTNVESFNSIYRTKLNGTLLFKVLENIILFDCEDRFQRFNQFNLNNLQNLNQRHGTSFKNYIVITFGKNDNSISSLRNKIDLIKDRFKIPINSSYTILNSEIDSFESEIEMSKVNFNFYGVKESTFWDSFLIETSYRNLYELRSIKLMNIYSICYDYEIKNYILDEIFSKNETSDLITYNTKISLLQYSEEEIKELKESLSSILDIIINSNIKQTIKGKINNTDSIVLDEFIIKNNKLKPYLEKQFQFRKVIKLKSWSDSSIENENSLFLSYRDQGRYPNYFYPNIFELTFNQSINREIILPKIFFMNNYNWAKYNLYKEYHKNLNHPIRELHFNWSQLNKLIQSEKPNNELFNFDWNLENEYFNYDNRETYKVKLLNNKPKSYHSSDLIIYSDINSVYFRIDRIKWFFENIDFDESKYRIQKLEELLDEFNPAEKLIDTTQQELELQIIRKQLGLENETAGRIWKVLLNKKSNLIGIDTLYEDLHQIFSKNNIPLVKQSYFISSWLNIQSDSLMPRGNKVVKVLFDYLQLSNNYRLILYRIKNASISGKIEATKKYSNLLKDLFDDGCFDSGVNLKDIIQNKVIDYQKNHSLEELGIDSENQTSDLMALVELIKPEIKPFELEFLEKIV